MPEVHQQSRRFARLSAGRSSRSIGALRLGQVLMIAGLCFCTARLLAQTSDFKTTDQRNNSWTATTDLKASNVNPTHISEGHSQNGNRTLDKQSVQILGSGGEYKPYQDIEKETLQVDAATVRTTTRAFARDSDGRKTLVQVIEEEKRTLFNEDSKIVRITSNPDLSGRLEIAQREIVETRMTGVGTEEMDTTVMLPSVNGLVPALKSHELRKRGANSTVESLKTTLLADGAGNFEVVETRQSSTRQEANERSTEERICRLDAYGKLVEVSRVISKESGSTSGEKRSTVEIYSVDVAGRTSDGNLHLAERATTTEHSNTATGEQITQKQVEQSNPGDPDSGLRLTTAINDTVRPGPSGSLVTRTIRTRDGSGNLGVVSVQTTNSDRVSTIQIQQTPSEQPR